MSERQEVLTSRWNYFMAWWEGSWKILAPLAAVAGVIVGYHQYTQNKAYQSLEAAWSIYREVDHAWIEYARLCLPNPWLDCYPDTSVPPGTVRDLSPYEKMQQQMMYDMLTDVFESAYVHFVKFRDHIASDEGRKLLHDQWGGWELYIKRFLNRPAYLAVWLDVYDEYDDEMRCEMNKLIKDTMSKSPPALEQPLKDRLSAWIKETDGFCARMEPR